MKIDIFNHIFPERFFAEFLKVASGLKDMGKRVRNISTMVDLDARFRMMDEFGEYCQVISLASPPLEAFAGPELSPNLAQMDWVDSPLRFSEQLTAFLWTSRQIDSFRAAAVAYVEKLDAAMPHESLSISPVRFVVSPDLSMEMHLRCVLMRRESE